MTISSTATLRLDAAIPRLDPREEHFRIPSSIPGLRLFLRYLPPKAQPIASSVVALYVHGGTFPSALSIAHRFDGYSWRDHLVDAGIPVWGLDFHGFGASDRYPEMATPAEANPVLCRAEDASRQIECAARFIAKHHGIGRISLIAHSWGSIPTGRFAGRCPELVDRIVLFGPIPRREGMAERQRFGAWRYVSLEDQWSRFTAEVPKGEAPVLSRRHFDEWGPLYLDTDPGSRTRTPASVQVPSGPWSDIGEAYASALAYDPALVKSPVAIIRGEWDTLITDRDAQWLFGALRNAPIKRDVKISRATHLMHLEEGRYELYREAQNFLIEGSRPHDGYRP